LLLSICICAGGCCDIIRSVVVSSRSWPPNCPYFHQNPLSSTTRSFLSSRSPPLFPGSAAVSQIRSSVSVASTYFPLCSIPSFPTPIERIAKTHISAVFHFYLSTSYVVRIRPIYFRSFQSSFPKSRNPKAPYTVHPIPEILKKCLRTEKSSRQIRTLHPKAIPRIKLQTPTPTPRRRLMQKTHPMVIRPTEGR
jgi:hypothetical protein